MQLSDPSTTTHQLSSFNSSDTICALATPAGGAISIIRMSGTQAINIAEKVFISNSKRKLSEAKGQTLHYGHIKDHAGHVIDDVLISLFRAPHSYTGEDCIEISCHGSRYIISKILEQLIKEGCRQATPGEYTQRAFLNGKMDLSQAEAVADLIASTNQATHKIAMSQLKGNFSDELSILRDELLKITSLLELELDFSDHEDLEFADRNELLQLAKKINHRITTLAHSFETGNAIKKGVAVAIVGKTNVGKSTLLNQLLHEQKAIVSDIHGTTRDVIEDTTEINGVTFRFIDTAGIRQTTDQVESLGIERTYQKLNEAQIILWVVDDNPTQEEIKEMVCLTNDRKLICVQNKIDLAQNTNAANTQNKFKDHLLILDNSKEITTLQISAKLGTNISELEKYIYRAANIPKITENDVIITSLRHYEALIKSNESIRRLIQGLEQNLSGDLLSEDLRICLEQLAEITGGQITTHEVLGNIFKHFCIGK